MRLRLAPQAVEDLESIRVYLSSRSAEGAEHVRLAIAATVDLLVKFPAMGHKTDIEDIRVIPVPAYSYLVYHRVGKGVLTVVHIRHASRSILIVLS